MRIDADLYEKKIAWLADCFGAKLTKIRAELYLETVIEFPLDVVQQVFKDFARHSKSMPSVADVEKECIAKRNYFNSQQPVGKGDAKCQYWFQGESEISRGLCEGFSSVDDVHFSIMQFGKVYCNWHYQCAYVKKYPADTQALVRVQKILKDAKHRISRGIDVPEFDKGTGEILRSASNLAKGWGLEKKVQEGGLNRV